MKPPLLLLVLCVALGWAVAAGVAAAFADVARALQVAP